ncbi:MAG: hypothetical protein WCC67_01180, partial [Candidatus Acidiferrales bacterium]
MHPALRIASLFLFAAMCVSPSQADAQLASNMAALPEASAQPGHASLKICLRQQDDTAFTGLATIQLTSSGGAVITGHGTDSDDQTTFPDL